MGGPGQEREAGRTLMLPACYTCGNKRTMREETMRILAFIILALFLGAGPASAWEEYIYLDQGVAIQFPAKPAATKSTYDSNFGKGFPSTIYSAEHDHVRYALT